MRAKILHSANQKSGFTLVELLVVISIIALLLAILMPSLQKARAQAKALVCGANLRSIGLGFNMYLIDNKNVYPPALKGIWRERDTYERQANPKMPGYQYLISDGTSGSTGHWVSWMDLVFSFLSEEKKIFNCPDAWTATITYQPKETIPNYGYNGAISGTTAPYFLPGGYLSNLNRVGKTAKSGEIKRPGDKILTLDFAHPQSVLAGAANYAQMTTILYPNQRSLAAPHGGSRNVKTNALMCDGHVRTFGTSDPQINSGTTAVWVAPAWDIFR